jgi:CHAT domain-containing protein
VAVNQQLVQRPTEIPWLEARIALDLLGGDYETAMRRLDLALDLRPDDPGLLLYQATALALRARALRREDLSASAYEALSAIIQSSSQFRPIALFNRAILDEDMLLFQRAARDWRQYLELDHDSRWRSVAQKREADLAARMIGSPDDFPGAKEFLARSRSSRREDDYPVERYLENSVTEWLPQAFVRNAPDSAQFREALTRLSEITRTKNHDPWLEDLMGGPRTAGWRRGIESLSRAAVSNSSGERETAGQQARIAVKAFKRSENQAGVLAARVEGIFALNRSLTVAACLGAAQHLEGDLKALGYSYLLSQYLIELSGCQGRASLLAQAGDSLRRAETIAREAGYSAVELRGVSIEANRNNYAGNTTEAWNECWSGLQHFWTGRYGALRGHTLYFNLAMAAEQLGYRNLALALQQESSHWVRQTGNHLQAAEGLFREGLLAFRASDRADATAAFTASQRELDDLPADEVRSRYEWWLQRSLAEIDLDQASPGIALARLEPFAPRIMAGDLPYERLAYLRLRARTAATMGDHDGESRFLRLATDESERALVNLASEEDRIRWRVEAGSVFRRLVELTLDKPSGASEALRLWEWYLDRSVRAVPPHPRWADPEPLALSRLTTVTLVSFLWLPHRVGVWIADDRGVTFRWIAANSSRIAVLSRRFARECSDERAPEAEVRQTGLEIYSLIFGTVPSASAFRSNRTLLLEPDGEIGAIPFEALVEPGGRYLAESHPIIYSPGLRHWQRAGSETAISMDTNVLVVAAPSVSGKLAQQFPPLPDAREEGEHIAHRFHHANILSGNNGTLDAVRDRLSLAELFHFAGHGLSYSDDGALLLAATAPEEGSILTTAELAGRKLTHCALVVLSACSSGVGEKRGPVNPNSLVSGFLRAGVRNVVASRWRVDSAVTSALMDQFYEELLHGGGVAAALRSAASKVRRTRTHPYFWAGFSVFGA